MSAETISIGGKEFDLGLVLKAFAEQEKFNDQFSMGMMMAEVVRSLLRNEEHPLLSSDESSELDQADSAENVEAPYQEMSAEIFELQYGDVLRELGLSPQLESIDNPIMTKGKSAQPAQIRVRISDLGRFKMFLEAVPATLLQENSQLKRVLTHYLGDIRNQVISWRDQQDEKRAEVSQEMLELVAQFETKGFAEACGEIKELLKYYQENTLNEHLLIQNQGLLNSGISWGPARWHRDASEVYYQNRWKNALEILEVVGRNSRMSEMYQRLFQHLLSCIEVAENDIYAMGNLDERRLSFLATLNDVRQQLS